LGANAAPKRRKFRVRLTAPFWFFYLFLILVGFVPFPIAALFNWIESGHLHRVLSYWGTGLMYTAVCLFMLAAVIPSISVIVRRLHDTDHSGWWFWIGFVPIAGPILLLVWYCTKGTEGPNRFGDGSQK
jgi:uncharacterized membrane protein YhaH (DUF805 family)